MSELEYSARDEEINGYYLMLFGAKGINVLNENGEEVASATID